MNRKHLIIASLLSVVILFATFAAVRAWADNLTYSACLRDNGQLQSVAIGEQPAQACGNKEVQISWSRQGPQGDPGPAGPPGQPGVSGYEKIIQPVPIPVLAPNEEWVGTASCPAGKKLLGGGFSIYGLPNPWNVRAAASAPISDTTYEVRFVNQTAQASTAFNGGIYLICAIVLP